MAKADFPLVDVLRVTPLEGHKLWLCFSDGSEGIQDFTNLLDTAGEMIEPLKDQAYFERVFVEMGAPTWPNGYDLDPINLYMELRGSGALLHPAAE